eukprot:6187936-Pleurochrysis_carterae.AAC.3
MSLNENRMFAKSFLRSYDFFLPRKAWPADCTAERNRPARLGRSRRSESTFSHDRPAREAQVVQVERAACTIFCRASASHSCTEANSLNLEPPLIWGLSHP